MNNIRCLTSKFLCLSIFTLLAIYGDETSSTY
ncbi:Uncharacterised protein [Helicobacter muridarum]|uniref:Uncharacterized protein n=1 Tax=Helicobacter muridarum TaxID=216 RepID=A0A377PVM9_9HELI|nr:Uncharacterised protein [Helicobacter muridarum]